MCELRYHNLKVNHEVPRKTARIAKYLGNGVSSAKTRVKVCVGVILQKSNKQRGINEIEHFWSCTMACGGAINSTRLEMLSNDNYDTWKIQVEALLVINDMWAYVCGENPWPAVTGEGEAKEAAERAFSQWVFQDRKAKSDLILTMSPSELK